MRDSNRDVHKTLIHKTETRPRRLTFKTEMRPRRSKKTPQDRLETETFKTETTSLDNYTSIHIPKSDGDAFPP